ncbi:MULTISPECIES: hypothetical protein [Niastella]|uniref:Cytochrome C Planctomycete-type domain-containing protein n=1 Tax=Niastella soli TaxID=2821487 RepID=A0ABS3YP09_9BACT|nr:hypothetical protein [Niastella soli]MBO9199613.1 hypothetical protein [Niastella soli]
MKKSTTLAVFIVLIVILANACKKDSEENQDPGSGTVDCGTITTSFSGNVSALMSTSCAKSDCHNNGSTNGPGALISYNQIFNARVKIRVAVANGSMPRDASFTAAQKAIITCWIDGGAPNN